MKQLDERHGVKLAIDRPLAWLFHLVLRLERSPVRSFALKWLGGFGIPKAGRIPPPGAPPLKQVVERLDFLLCGEHYDRLLLRFNG